MKVGFFGVLMDEIVRFSGVLRENGIPASIRSTQTACDAVSLVKGQGVDLRETLACIYLKDQRQRKKFNECYDVFFENKGKMADKPASNLEDKDKFIRKLNISVTKQNKASFNYNDNFQYKLDYIKNTLNDADDNADHEGNSELIKSSIHTLNTLQPELIDLCQKLGRKIATRRVRRYKQSKKQKPDIRRTIRKNMKHGGSLLELVKSKPKIKKQNHFFLSDVSVSCDWISIWFFCMIYTAQKHDHPAGRLRVRQQNRGDIHSTTGTQHHGCFHQGFGHQEEELHDSRKKQHVHRLSKFPEPG